LAPGQLASASVHISHCIWNALPNPRPDPAGAAPFPSFISAAISPDTSSCTVAGPPNEHFATRLPNEIRLDGKFVVLMRRRVLCGSGEGDTGEREGDKGRVGEGETDISRVGSGEERLW
jgi:hypothetical protein